MSKIQAFPESNTPYFFSQVAQRIFEIYDTNQDGKIDFREFMCGLSVMLRGTLEQRLRITFSIFDLDGDGYVSKDELLEIITVRQNHFNSKILTSNDACILNIPAVQHDKCI